MRVAQAAGGLRVAVRPLPELPELELPELELPELELPELELPELLLEPLELAGALSVEAPEVVALPSDEPSRL